MIVIGALTYALVPALLLAVTHFVFLDPLPFATVSDWFRFAGTLAVLGAIFAPLLAWAQGAKPSFARTFVQMLAGLTAFVAMIAAGHLLTDPLWRWVILVLLTSCIIAAFVALVARIVARGLALTDAA